MSSRVLFCCWPAHWPQLRKHLLLGQCIFNLGQLFFIHNSMHVLSIKFHFISFTQHCLTRPRRIGLYWDSIRYVDRSGYVCRHDYHGQTELEAVTLPDVGAVYVCSHDIRRLVKAAYLILYLNLGHWNVTGKSIILPTMCTFMNKLIAKLFKHNYTHSISPTQSVSAKAVSSPAPHAVMSLCSLSLNLLESSWFAWSSCTLP